MPARCDSVLLQAHHVNVSRELQLEQYIKYSALLGGRCCVLIVNVSYYWCCLLRSQFHYCVLHLRVVPIDDTIMYRLGLQITIILIID